MPSRIGHPTPTSSVSRGPSVVASQKPTGPSTESSGSMPVSIASRAASAGFPAANVKTTTGNNLKRKSSAIRPKSCNAVEPSQAKSTYTVARSEVRATLDSQRPIPTNAQVSAIVTSKLRVTSGSNAGSSMNAPAIDVPTSSTTSGPTMTSTRDASTAQNQSERRHG